MFIFVIFSPTGFKKVVKLTLALKYFFEKKNFYINHRKLAVKPYESKR